MTTTTPANPFGFDMTAYTDAADRIRELSERLVASSRAAGNTSLETLEKTVESMVALEEKMAGASQLEWVSTLAQTHTAVVRDITAAYTSAAREMLNAAPVV